MKSAPHAYLPCVGVVACSTASGELQRLLDAEVKRREGLEEQLADAIDSLAERVSEAASTAEVRRNRALWLSRVLRC